VATKLDRIRAVCAAQPREPFAWYSLAMELWKTSTTEATETFVRVHRDFPDYLPAYYQHGKLLAELGRPEAARPVLEAGIVLARRVGDGHALGELSAALDGLDD
jgi:hypothetical protein